MRSEGFYTVETKGWMFDINFAHQIKDEADASGKSPYIVRLHDFFDVGYLLLLHLSPAPFD